MMNVFLVVILSFACIIDVQASVGDNTQFFRKCLEDCRRFNCTKDGSEYRNEQISTQPFIDKLLLWDCKEECKYECMWRTVHFINERNWEIPQFFGKWPFKRVWGMQEFGSVIGSILNLLAHYVNYQLFKKVIPSRHSMFWLWRLFYLVCFNAWIWSTIFHIRDTPFTEFMDYMCAFSMVLMMLYCLGMRVMRERYGMLRVIFSCLCISYFANHALYLYYNKIDYNYNMIANIVVGVLWGVGWTVWCFYNLLKRRTYVWRCLLFVFLTAASMLLELNDFPPIMSMWDAHAVWHLSTSPLPFMFYRFIIDDCKYMRKHLE